MTGFVGLDRTLLAALRAGMHRAGADMRGLRCDDREADDAMGTIRWAIDLVEQRWLPVVDRALTLDQEAAVRRVEAIASVSGPLAAAPSVGGLHLDDDELADLVIRLLVVWHDGDSRGNLWHDRAEPGPNAADVLFALLIDRPRAAAAFLARAARQPELVLRSAIDETLVRRLLVVGTSPDQVGAADAGRVLVPLLHWLRHGGGLQIDGWYGTTWSDHGPDGATPGAHAMLGEVIAPWLPQFGHRADDWGWSRAAADDALRWVVTDAEAMTALVGALHQWRASLAGIRFVRFDGSVDTDALLEVSTTLGQLTLAFHAADLHAGEVGRFWLDVSVLLAGAVASLALPVVGIGGVAALAIKTAAGAGTRTTLDRLGVVASSDRAAERAQARFGTLTADTAVVAVVSVVGRLVDDGRLPAGSLERLRLDDERDDERDGERDGGDDCRSAEVLERLQRYVADIAADADPVVANALTAVLLAFAGPTAAVEAC